MLKNSFCHIPEFGCKMEEQLSSRGVLSWKEAILASELPLSLSRRETLQEHLMCSTEELSKNNATYFSEALPAGCIWRLFPEFRKDTAFIDIETTGLDGPGDYITTIAVFDGHKIQHYVYGQNLTDFKHDIGRFKVIVTYNGSIFDLPFIRSRLEVPMDQTHIDLRQLLASLDITGGLKKCEAELGIGRGVMTGINGLFTMGLWLDYSRGNDRALETLLAYNVLDSVHLETLMVRAYNLKIRQTPFAKCNRLSEAEPFVNIPFTPHIPTIERLKRRYSLG